MLGRNQGIWAPGIVAKFSEFWEGGTDFFSQAKLANSQVYHQPGNPHTEHAYTIQGY